MSRGATRELDIANPSSAPGSGYRLENVQPAVLSVGDEIGKGRFKRVHRGRYKRKEVVILRYAKDGDSNELRILTLLGQQGPNLLVPEIYGLCTERDATSVVQEIAEWGALKSVLKDKELGKRVTTPHRLRAASQMANALAFLQSCRVVHADLSCRNVLVCRLDPEPHTFLVKITDFGLSVVLEEGADFANKKQPQATRWCAPETIAYQKLSHRADAWSYGALVWEMFADAALPWAKREKRGDVAARLRDLAENEGLAEGGPGMSADFPCPSACPPSAHKLILSCFVVDELSRPTFPQLQQSFGRVIEETERTPEEGDAAPGGDGKAPRTLTPSTGAPSGFASSGLDTPPAEAVSAPPADGELQSAAAARVIHFKALKAFLRSPASESVSDSSMQAIWKEIEDAQNREAYLLDLVRRMQGVMPGGAALEIAEPKQDAALSPHPRTSTRLSLARASAPCLVPSTLAAAPRSISAGRPVRVSHSPQMSYAPSSEHLVGNSSMLPPSAPGMWTLWSFAGPQLRRQDFMTEGEAWAACDAAAKVSPCMLRDPSGAEAAARNWVASYVRHPSPSAAPGSGHHLAAVAPVGPAGVVPGVVSLSAMAAAAAAAASAASTAMPLKSPKRGSSAWRTGLVETLGGSLRSAGGSAPPSCPSRGMPQEPVFDAAFARNGSALSARGPYDGRATMDLSCSS